MAVTARVRLGDLIDETLSRLLRPQEMPVLVTVGQALSTPASTQFTLQTGADLVSVSDIVEFGDELVLVTGKTADATPIFTCARGYAGTPASVHTSGSVGRKSPTWSRWQVRRAVVDALEAGIVGFVPEQVTTVRAVGYGAMWVTVPEEAISVARAAVVTQDGRLVELKGWD